MEFKFFHMLTIDIISNILQQSWQEIN